MAEEAVATVGAIHGRWRLLAAKPLREVIEGPAGLACLDVSEVKGLILEQAKDEPGALPLVENALEWLWNKKKDNRLSERQLTEAGGLAGILSHSADNLLGNVGEEGRMRALELLFRLVRVDPEGYRHARQQMSLVDAIEVAGGGECGGNIVERLAGQRTLGRTANPVRLITISEEASGSGGRGGRWVNLIHETLVRNRVTGAEGPPQPYWETLWQYIEKHKERAAWLRRLKEDTQFWVKIASALAIFGRTSGCGRRWRRWGRSALRSC